ncbi:hypothetical protein [Ralstonia sp. UBA689]|uniref:hypothetical protein n=1 Tax=Ralstonia sp. UBA689 TaxID=1947373 RepID=UPI0025D51695|nr:hypothetical protein [Ralstonia sp. UBA689]
MAEADFTASEMAENDASAATWSAFDDAYHRVKTLIDAIECIATAHLDMTTREIADEPGHWAPLFHSQISNIYSLAAFLDQTLEKDLRTTAVALRGGAERGIH